MLNLFLHSGLVNTTFWLTVAAFLLVLVSWLRSRRCGGLDSPGPLPRLFSSRIVLVLLFGGTLVNLGAGLYRGYVAPKDLLQDIISAQEFLAGRSLYPDNMNHLMEAAEEREPAPPSLGNWSPALREREQEERHAAVTLHWVQAHPPFMTLCLTPFVAVLGITGTYVAVVLVSLAALALTVVLLVRGLDLHLTRGQLTVLVLGVLGWGPLITALRAGQSGLVLGALLTGAWFCLRRQRPAFAGVLVGVACALKVFPGLLLVYLLLRHRRAFLSGAATVLSVFVLGGLLTGWHTYAEYQETIRGVMPEYAPYPNNLSLLAVVARTLHETGSLSLGTRGLFYGLALVLVGGGSVVAWRNQRRFAGKPLGVGLECSVFIALMPLLSPVSWDHYLTVVLLPLAVLGSHTLTRRAGWAAALGFLGLVVVLAVPDTTFGWCLDSVSHVLGRVGTNLLFLSLRSYALLALSAWCACLAWRQRFGTAS